VFIDDLSTIEIDSNKKQVINTINPHSFIMAKNDKAFAVALHSSNTLLPDGSGIVLAAKKIKKKKIKKITGTDLHLYLLSELEKINGRIFYMGANKKTLDKIKSKIGFEYPNIIVDCYSPPFTDKFSKEDNEKIISEVNNFCPDVLFIGMTAPKQEKWLHVNKDRLDFKIASSIGAVFDFYAGTVQRSSQFWIDLHLEWLPRLLKEPRRLWKRNFISTPLFLWDMVKEKLR
jgi:N-acetylglucosaminyldiphosphoundecaprenol N-acetyl-beta-D-mannosaminyltransferase